MARDTFHQDKSVFKSRFILFLLAISQLKVVQLLTLGVISNPTVLNEYLLTSQLHIIDIGGRRASLVTGSI